MVIICTQVIRSDLNTQEHCHANQGMAQHTLSKCIITRRQLLWLSWPWGSWCQCPPTKRKVKHFLPSHLGDWSLEIHPFLASSKLPPSLRDQDHLEYLITTKLSIPGAESRLNVLWRTGAQQVFRKAWSCSLLDPQAKELATLNNNHDMVKEVSYYLRGNREPMGLS